MPAPRRRPAGGDAAARPPCAGDPPVFREQGAARGGRRWDGRRGREVDARAERRVSQRAAVLGASVRGAAGGAPALLRAQRVDPRLGRGVRGSGADVARTRSGLPSHADRAARAAAAAPGGARAALLGGAVAGGAGGDPRGADPHGGESCSGGQGDAAGQPRDARGGRGAGGAEDRGDGRVGAGDRRAARWVAVIRSAIGQRGRGGSSRVTAAEYPSHVLGSSAM